MDRELSMASPRARLLARPAVGVAHGTPRATYVHAPTHPFYYGTFRGVPARLVALSFARRWKCLPRARECALARARVPRGAAATVAQWIGPCGKAWHRRGDSRGCSPRKLGSRTGRGLPRLPRPHWCVSVRSTSHATCQGNSRATCHSLRARNTTRRSRALGCLAASWRHGSAYLCSVTVTAVQSTRQLVQQMGGACGGPSCRTAFRYSMRPTLTARTSRLSGGRAATYPTGALVGVETPRRKTRASSLGVLAAPTGGAHPSTGSWRFWRTSHSSTSPRSAICPAY